MTAWQVTGSLLAGALLLGGYDRVRSWVVGAEPGRRSTLARLLLAGVRAYQRWISPLRPPACRFTPSCSAYAVTALERHGAVRGGWLATRRLLRCGPWHPGGHDPVPAVVGSSGAGNGTPPDAATSTPTGAPRC
jgi:hypothetical protein